MSGQEGNFADDLQDLPSPPAVVMELLSNMEQDDADVALLARKVSTDQALTAKTLRLVNSSMYGLATKVTTVQQAITFLGFQTTRNLVTAAALTGCFPDRQCAGFDHQAFWRHALAVASCASVLARHLHINRDIAFTAGLLHDIGRLVLVTLHPRRYAEVIAQRTAGGTTLLDAERAVMAVDHMMAGAALARHWNFSGTMEQALAFHHAPEEPGACTLAELIHVADAVVHALDLAGAEDEQVPALSQPAWDAVGLDQREWLQVFRETELQFEEMATILAA